MGPGVVRGSGRCREGSRTIAVAGVESGGGTAGAPTADIRGPMHARAAVTLSPVASDLVRRVRPLERLLPKNRDAAKQAPLTRIEIRARVQGTAVVPQHEVTRTPNMFVDKTPLLLVVK